MRRKPCVALAGGCWVRCGIRSMPVISSSYLIAAKASGAKVVALANGGGDMTGAVKQASEFGLQKGGQALVPLLCTNSDIHSLGLPVAQGMTLMTSFTWDRTEQTRAWSRRFFDRHHAMPSMDHAATYSAVAHYIRAIAAAGTTDTQAVAAKMRDIPVRDCAFRLIVIANSGGS